jgi:hypothetical protein
MTKKKRRTEDKIADSTVWKHFTDGTDSPIRKLHRVRRFINRTDSPTAPIRRLANSTGSSIWKRHQITECNRGTARWRRDEGCVGRSAGLDAAREAPIRPR